MPSRLTGASGAEDAFSSGASGGEGSGVARVTASSIEGSTTGGAGGGADTMVRGEAAGGGGAAETAGAAGARVAVAAADAGAAPTITEDTFLEMKACFRFFAARDDVGNWTRYQSPSMACRRKTVPELTRARIGLFWLGADRMLARADVTLTTGPVCANADPAARTTPSTVTRQIESLFMALLSVRVITDIDGELQKK
jgi:hypothetical protein